MYIVEIKFYQKVELFTNPDCSMLFNTVGSDSCKRRAHSQLSELANLCAHAQLESHRDKVPVISVTRSVTQCHDIISIHFRRDLSHFLSINGEAQFYRN